MTEILFPDLCRIVIDGLRDGFSAAGVNARIGKTYGPDPQYPSLSVKRTGGRLGIEQLRDGGFVTVWAWACVNGSDPIADAHHAAQTAHAIVFGLTGTSTIDGRRIGRVTEISGLAEDPDPVTELDRFAFTAQIPISGALLTRSQ